VQRWLIRPDDWIFNLFAVSGWLGVRSFWVVGGHRVQRRDVRTRKWIFHLCAMSGWLGVWCFGFVGGHSVH